MAEIIQIASGANLEHQFYIDRVYITFPESNYTFLYQLLNFVFKKRGADLANIWKLMWAASFSGFGHVVQCG